MKSNTVNPTFAYPYDEPRPKVGVAAVITIGTDDSLHFLMGKRLKPFGYGKYAFPGGHMEFSEDPFKCANREVLEETGINLKELLNFDDNQQVNSVGFTNDIEGEHHYVTLYVHYHLGDTIPEIWNEKYGCDEWVFPKVVNTEPDKCAGWKWISVFEHFPTLDMWEPIKEMFVNYQDHFNQFGDIYID